MIGHRFGPIKSFESYKKSNGTEWKAKVMKKRDEKDKDQYVVITLGVLEWSEEALCLKQKRGQ